MSIEGQLVYALMVLLVGQQLWFYFAVNRLINKVMSRNYTTYVQANQLKKEKPVGQSMDFNLGNEEAEINYTDEATARVI